MNDSQYPNGTGRPEPPYGAPVYAAPAPEPGRGSQNTHAKTKHQGAKTFGTAFVGALVACVLALSCYAALNPSKSGSSSAASVTLGSSESSVINASDTGETLAEAVAAKALPSVACIYVYTDQQSSYGYFGTSASGDSNELTESSLGSGVVLSSDGYILTNYHVVEGSDALKVSLGGEEYDATVVGTDESSDLAVIKIDATGLTPADIGDSDNLTVGEWVMTIGSPFGLEQSVATGVVSATSRSQIVDSSSSSGSGNGYGYGYGSSSSTSSSPTIYPNMIQTDAAINPGNSGGALVDSNGKVIGINTLITSYSGNYSGVGFAIPINYAINIAEQIISGQTPTHAALGVSLTTINSTMAQRYGLATSSGVYVSRVASGSGAEEAGIQEGDIITAFDGKAVTSASDLLLDVREKNVGDTVKVTINRDGSTQDVEVTLGSDGTTSSTQSSSTSSRSGSGSGSSSGLGGIFSR